MSILSKIRDLSWIPPKVVPMASNVSSATRLNYAHELDVSGKVLEAELIYRDMLKLDPTENGAAINLGDLLVRQNRFADAALLLKDVLDRYPDCSVAWCNLSAALSGLGNKEEALVAANKAVEKDPDNAMAYYNRAECWCDLNQTRLSIRDFETAVELAPHNEEISEKLALARLAIQETVKQPFGDVKHEMNAHGAWIVDGIEVASTLQCPHCNMHFPSMRGSGFNRFFCLRCGDVTCGKPQCNACVPYRMKLDQVAEGTAIFV